MPPSIGGVGLASATSGAHVASPWTQPANGFGDFVNGATPPSGSDWVEGMGGHRTSNEARSRCGPISAMLNEEISPWHEYRPPSIAADAPPCVSYSPV